MNFGEVQEQLTSLPNTFLRRLVPFTQYMDALTAGITRETAALDNMSVNVNDFQQASYGWLDVWGLLYNVARFSGEADQIYRNRIQYEVTAGGGPPVAIAKWIFAVWQVNVIILENLPNVGYQIIFPGTLTTAQIQAIMDSIVRVRPAGVPITIAAQTVDGLYLQTINFLSAADVTGAYLSSIASQSAITLRPTTNNLTPLLPDLFLTDPTLNPP